MINLEKHNFHWRSNFSYNFPKKRILFEKIAKRIDERQIISIIGLRRTGKTTILKQCIDLLIAGGRTKRENILYFSFDEEQPALEELFNKFEEMTGAELKEMKTKIYVFLDEVQKLTNWQNQAKYYYDNYSNIKFFVSGSASLFIKKDSLESLAGRIYEFILKPLSFAEFLTMRGKGDLVEKPKLFSESLKKEFHFYAKRQFIEVIDKPDDIVNDYMKTLLEKIVYIDLPKIFPIEHADLLPRIMKIVAAHPGMISDYGGISRELGISRITMSNYFFYLEEVFLLKKIYNFSNNMLTSEKKSKKFYLYTPSFFSYLNDTIEESMIIENLVISSIPTTFFWRDPSHHEVDCVLIDKKKIIPVEIKYKNALDKRDLKGLLKFCDKFNARHAILVTKDKAGKERAKTQKGRDVELEYVPAGVFLLRY